MRRARAVKSLFSPLALLLAGVLLLPAVSWAQSGEGRRLIVVVNKGNPVESLTDKELANIFLGKISVWKSGDAILTCDLIEQDASEEESARARFAEEYLGKDLYSIKSYWIKMIFSAKRRPPITMKKAGEVIRFVAENRGGIGYVYKDQASDEVKVVRVRLTGR
ncbi:MAG: hypothetical protein ACNS63_02740 [Candidatus Nitrospinota bacterium M3_3B_026]